MDELQQLSARLITVDEVSALLKVQKQTIYNGLSSGRFKRIKILDKTFMDREEVKGILLEAFGEHVEEDPPRMPTHKRFIDITGRKFGRLTVLKFSRMNKARVPYWICRCECSTEKEISGYALRHGRTKSCGCLQREPRKKKPVAGLKNQLPDDPSEYEPIRLADLKATMKKMGIPIPERGPVCTEARPVNLVGE